MQFRSILPLTFCAGCIGSLCAAQTPVTFSPVSSTTGATPANIYAVDLNNDGVSDIVQDTAQSPSAFTVSINNLNGTFKAPVTYTLPGTHTVPMPIATGDFNNDGKVDIAVILAGTNQVAVYLGNGDGTLQSPKLSTLSLPAGWTFNTGGVAAADFNADGKIDLVAWTTDYVSSLNQGTQSLYVLEGDGAGGFTNPTLALAGPTTQPDFQVFVGDYDSDGRADIAATTYTLASNGSTASTILHVLYGNNNFTFDDTTPYTATGNLHIGSGDLNSDGFTDLYGVGQQLGVFYGNSSRTFSSYFMTLSSTYPASAAPDGNNYMSQLTQGDFNGDGLMDLAIMGWNAGYTQAYVEVLLAGSSPGQFTQQEIALPTTYTWDTPPVAGIFTSTRLVPDVAFNQSPNGGSPPQNTPSYLVSEVNYAHSGWFGPCYYPTTGQGFNVCAPGTVSGSTATFNAAVNSYGKLRKIELWVDGKKVSEQHHTWDQHGYFTFASAFAAGTHNATFFAADIDNRLQRHDFTFTIGSTGGCNAAGGNGVYICSPNPTAPVSSPFQVTATASITGTLARMELWVDGTNKVYTETNSLTLSTTISLPPGNHELAVAAVNTAGTKWGGYMQITVQ